MCPEGLQKERKVGEKKQSSDIFNYDKLTDVERGVLEKHEPWLLRLGEAFKRMVEEKQ